MWRHSHREPSIDKYDLFQLQDNATFITISKCTSRNTTLVKHSYKRKWRPHSSAHPQFDNYFLKIFGGHLWGHWQLCFEFWVISPLGFKSRVGSLISHLAEAYMLHIRWDSPLVQHLLTSWQPVWQPSPSLPKYLRAGIGGAWNQSLSCRRCPTMWDQADILPTKLCQVGFQFDKFYRRYVMTRNLLSFRSSMPQQPSFPEQSWRMPGHLVTQDSEHLVSRWKHNLFSL